MTKATIGFAMCGSFCTFSKAFTQMKNLLYNAIVKKKDQKVNLHCSAIAGAAITPVPIMIQSASSSAISLFFI